jgi:hypothetical protein
MKLLCNIRTDSKLLWMRHNENCKIGTIGSGDIFVIFTLLTIKKVGVSVCVSYAPEWQFGETRLSGLCQAMRYCSGEYCNLIILTLLCCFCSGRRTVYGLR